MKKFSTHIGSAIVAIACVSFTKVNTDIFQPLCPEGTELFYFQRDSQSFSNGTPVLNALNTTSNWLITHPPGTDKDCGGTIRVCAICAPVLDPSAETLRPDLSDSDLQSKFQDYSTTRNVNIDDQEPVLFFERN